MNFSPIPFVFASLVFPISSAYSYSQKIEEFDKASGLAVLKVEAELQKPGVVDSNELRSYAADTTRNGQKRYHALRLSLKDLPVPEQDRQILEVFGTEKNRDFLYAAVGDMGGWNDPKAASVLKNIIESEKSNSCLSLIAGSSLARMNIPDGKSNAVAAILNQIPYRDFAMLTLANLGAVDVITQLENNPKSKVNRYVEDDCQLAILRIRLHGKSISEQETMADEAFESSKFGGVRRWAGMYLGNIGDEKSFQDLIRATKDSRDLSKQDWARRVLQMGVERGQGSTQKVNSAEVGPR